MGEVRWSAAGLVLGWVWAWLVQWYWVVGKGVRFWVSGYVFIDIKGI